MLRPLFVLIQPLDEPHHIDDHSLMRAGTNRRDAIGRFDIELDAATIDFGYLRSGEDRKSTRLNSSHSQISYAVFCLKKKKKKKIVLSYADSVLRDGMSRVLP